MLAILTQRGFADNAASDGDARPVGVVLQATPFYAESGGQVADTGTLSSLDATFSVQDTQVCKPAIVGRHAQQDQRQLINNAIGTPWVEHGKGVQIDCGDCIV